jgi:hypothetical protein
MRRVPVALYLAPYLVAIDNATARDLGRSETFVAALLTIVIGVVILVALYRLEKLEIMG